MRDAVLILFGYVVGVIWTTVSLWNRDRSKAEVR